jgi:hypothetical protein
MRTLSVKRQRRLKMKKHKYKKIDEEDENVKEKA